MTTRNDNLASQRTNTTRIDASTVAFRYDNIGQLNVADSSLNSEDRKQVSVLTI